MGDELSALESAALRHIARGRRAWSEIAAMVAAGYDEETLVGLVASGWVEGWSPPSGPAVTLTPWAAERMGLRTTEHWEFVTTEEKPDGEGGKRKKRRERPDPVAEVAAVSEHVVARRRRKVRNAVEVPHWEMVPPEELAHQRGEPGAKAPKKVPIVLPRRHRECRLPGWLLREWEDVADGPERRAAESEEYLLTEKRTDQGNLDVDPESGEVRRERVKLWGQDIPRETGKRRTGKKKAKRRMSA